MNFSPQDMVKPGDILADVLSFVDDSDYKTRSKGWYMSQIQQALTELSLDTFYFKKFEIIDIPQDLRIDIPQGCYNPRQIYAFNGDECHIGNRINVWHKTNFYNSGDGNSFVSRNTGSNNDDPYYQNRNRMNQPEAYGTGMTERVYYYSIQNGIIMLSVNCRNFQKLFVEFNGFSANIGDVPFVPVFARQAIKDWVSLQALPHRMRDSVGTSSYNYWASMLAMTKSKLEEPYDGTWVKAERRAKVLDSKYRQDLKEYLSKMNY